MTYPPNGGPMYPGPPSGPYYSDAATAALTAQRNRRRTTWILAAIVAILALLVGIGVVHLYSVKTGKELIPWLTLRSADDPGADPFTPSVSLAHNNGPVSAGSATVASYQGSQVVNGTEPGLYATGAGPSCDAAGLNRYLESNPAAADAWAGVFGIRRADIPWYINTLSPVLLTHDTWVTNHTYKSGVASPMQSVLQAGTPVFVDAAGVPRAVCACGNPLLPPASAPISGYRTTGHPWNGYDRSRTTRVATHNTYVTTVNNVTTVVNRPATPAPLTPLQVVEIVTGVLTTAQTSGLDLPAPPPGMTLPDPTTANATPKFTSAVAADQGMRADSDQPAEHLTEGPVAGSVETSQAGSTESVTPNDGTPEPTVPSDDPSSPSTTTQAPGTTGTESPATTSSTPSTTTTTSTSTAPSSTSFSGSGDTIGSFSFTDDGSTVTCSVPSATGDSTVSLTCSDSVSRSVSASSLDRSSVTSATTGGLWTLTTSSGSVEVTSATWE